MNTSIKSLNLSDNDLNDSHARTICNFLLVKAEARDLLIWESSLRQRLPEKRLSVYEKRLEDHKIERGKSSRTFLYFNYRKLKEPTYATEQYPINIKQRTIEH